MSRDLLRGIKTSLFYNIITKTIKFLLIIFKKLKKKLKKICYINYIKNNYLLLLFIIKTDS
jgi:hypothetical protein